MAKFLFIYHGGQAPETEDEMNAEIARWGKWIGDNEAAFLDPGNPVGQSYTVSETGVVDNGGANPASGYGIITASDIDAAIAIAKASPATANGGSVEVAEIHDIPM